MSVRGVDVGGTSENIFVRGGSVGKTKGARTMLVRGMVIKITGWENFDKVEGGKDRKIQNVNARPESGKDKI